MQILKFEAENIKRLGVVAIEPDTGEPIVVIGGDNEQGKSSVLDAIEWALGGKAGIDDEPIRRGQEAARTVIQLRDMTVERRYKRRKGGGWSTNLTVTSNGGQKLAGPQDILNGLIGHLSFDPLGFVRMKPAEQHQTLCKLAGLDLSAQDKKRKEYYDMRTEANRRVSTLEEQLKAVPFTEDVPEQELTMVDLAKELERRQKHNITVKAGVSALSQAVALLDQRKRELSAAKFNMDKAESALELSKEKAQSLEVSESEVVAQMQGAEKTNALVRQNTQHQGIANDLHSARVTQEGLNERLATMDEATEEAIKGAKYPVDGLSVDGDGVKLNGIPFSQCSSGEQLRVSVAMGLAINPKLKVILIRDGSLLDKNSLKMIGQMAKDAGAQIWMERVGVDQETTVVIEDGSVLRTGTMTPDEYIAPIAEQILEQTSESDGPEGLPVPDDVELPPPAPVKSPFPDSIATLLVLRKVVLLPDDTKSLPLMLQTVANWGGPERKMVVDWANQSIAAQKGDGVAMPPPKLVIGFAMEYAEG